MALVVLSLVEPKFGFYDENSLTLGIYQERMEELEFEREKKFDAGKSEIHVRLPLFGRRHWPTSPLWMHQMIYWPKWRVPQR